MVAVQPRTTDPTVAGLGEAAGTLLRVAQSGIRTVPSIIVGKKLFAAFLSYVQSGESTFKDLLAETIDAVRTRLASRVDVRTSFDATPPGFPEFPPVRNTARSLKRTILEIFSVWSDDKFRAFWVVEDLEGAATYPALLIQNKVKREFSLVSREPVSGDRTTASNIDVNIDVVIRSFRPAHARFLRRIERIAGFPVKVVFAETPNLQLLRVERAIMTVPGWLSALSSMKAEGVLDPLGTLRLIDPTMIAGYKGQRQLLEPASIIAAGLGIPASPGYATGKILLPQDPLPRDGSPHIFVCLEESPEHVNHVKASDGGLAAFGGMTSHLAMILRAYGKPGVTGASALMLRGPSISVGDTSIPKHAYLYVDGNSGRFTFSLDPFQTAPVYEASTDRVFLQSVLSDLHELTCNRRMFAALPMADQLHLAYLTRAFAKIGMKAS